MKGWICALLAFLAIATINVGHAQASSCKFVDAKLLKHSGDAEWGFYDHLAVSVAFKVDDDAPHHLQFQIYDAKRDGWVNTNWRYVEGEGKVRMGAATGPNAIVSHQKKYKLRALMTINDQKVSCRGTLSHPQP